MLQLPFPLDTISIPPAEYEVEPAGVVRLVPFVDGPLHCSYLRAFLIQT